jgi:hypothetical protein
MTNFCSLFVTLSSFLFTGQVKYHYDENGWLYLEKGYRFSLYDIANKRTIILDSTHTTISTFDNMGKLLWLKKPVTGSSITGYEISKFYIKSMWFATQEIGFLPKTRYQHFGNINKAYASDPLTFENVIHISYETPYGLLNGSISLETGENYIFIQT